MNPTQKQFSLSRDRVRSNALSFRLVAVSCALILVPAAWSASIIPRGVIVNVAPYTTATDTAGTDDDSDAVAWFSYASFTATKSVASIQGAAQAAASGMADWQPGTTAFSARSSGSGWASVGAPTTEEARGTGGSFLQVEFGVDAPATFDLSGLISGLNQGDAAVGLYVELWGPSGQTLFRTLTQSGTEPFHITGTMTPGEVFKLQAGSGGVAVAGLSSPGGMSETRVDNSYDLRLQIASVPDCPSTGGIAALGLLTLGVAQLRWRREGSPTD